MIILASESVSGCHANEFVFQFEQINVISLSEMFSAIDTLKSFLTFFSIVSLTLFFFHFSSATDSLTPITPLEDGRTLVSSGQKFELGFFSCPNTSRRYLGIWYKQDPETVVWVANRNNPITGSDGVLRINSDGQLILLNQTHSILWYSNSSKLAQDPRAQLLDTGNLAILDQSRSVSSGGYLWQSFDHPTDTMLPDERIGRGLNQEPDNFLTSWKSPSDPSPGDFVNRFVYNGLSEVVINKGSIRKYRTGPWNGVRFSGVMPLNQAAPYVLNFRDNMLYNLYISYNSSVTTRIVISSSGLLNWYSFDEESKRWNLLHSVPNDPCENYGRCGANGFCSIMKQSMCDCLKGFTPKIPQKWELHDWSDGCVRRVPLNCTGGDRFFRLIGVKVPDLLEFWLDASMSLKQCKEMCLNNCSCTAYANSNISQGGSGCLLWFGDLIDVTEFSQEDSQQEIYIRLSASELELAEGNRKKIVVIVVACSVAAGILILGLLLWSIISRKQRKMKGEDLLKFDTKASLSAYKEEQNEVEKTRTKNTKLEIPLFNFSSVSAATNSFSLSNKLGEGGFGPVYKGNLLNGEEVAIKRLSTKSKQGWDELKNEALLIAKLQHKNLVKVLGCCIEGDENILIYEYLPNKSLDLFLFDTAKHGIIDWPTRVRIIEGIAQGLLYLHQHSRLTIVHRDLKASNILLDKDMNPKISDFGMARMFGGNQQGATNRIVGTYGYMAPEYALEGIFSVKSDVFSFGILLLEILSGKRNTSFYRTNFLNLLGYAWDLWTTGKPLELKDPNLEEMCCESGRSIGKKIVVMAAALSAASGLLILSLLLWCKFNRKLKNMKGEDLLKFNLKASLSSSKEEQNDVKKTITKKTELEIPLFSFSSVSAAANNFSPCNKLGEGGFGPVYKGNLLDGELVAIKRLSTRSKQGWDELKNEAVLIAKLQHKNLVKLLGCCIEGDENILIYEYLPNKSLDIFLFGSAEHGTIDWKTRVRIIEGIAQGLLYLHQYSRLTIIHRDLKASNILLDRDMNPKISDFGMARIFGGNQRGVTGRIVGTYGYMAPEYALEGIFSVKSDVFSFGILLLEILSSKRNTSFYQTEFLNLLGYAWDLWLRGKPLELKDPNLEETCCGNAGSELLTRYIHIALLCVQQLPAERPTMSEVVLMLGNEHYRLPSPKQPAFSMLRCLVDPTAQESKWKAEKYSVNLVTTSVVEPR